jgi:hypothetical protein
MGTGIEKKGVRLILLIHRIGNMDMDGYGPIEVESDMGITLW